MSKVNTPEQKKAIANLMAARKRAWKDDGRTASDFPKLKPYHTIADYIQLFGIGDKHVLPYDLAAPRRAPAAIVGPEVVEEQIEFPELA